THRANLRLRMESDTGRPAETAAFPPVCEFQRCRRGCGVRTGARAGASREARRAAAAGGGGEMRGDETMNTAQATTWQTICTRADLVAGSGVCALVGKEQVALFYLPDEERQIYALSNR